MTVINADAAKFRRMLDAGETFMADFYAEWCGPCKMLNYVLNDIENELREKIKILKINIDKEPQLTAEMDVNIIPGLFFIKDGTVQSRYTGFLPQEKLQPRLEALLGLETAEAAAPAGKAYDLIIIGGGAAGLTAAIYARRAGLRTLILESMAPGGKLIKTFELENWPGLKNVSGSQLAYDIYQQAMALGTDYLYEKAESITAEGGNRTIICQSGRVFSAPAVIIATGTVERMLNIPGETEVIGRGVSFCAVCDAAFYRGRPVIVIGAGNSAFEESLYLTDFASSVTILTRSDRYNAEQIIQEKAAAQPKITILQFREAREILMENGKVSGIRVLNTKTGREEILPAAGIFPYIGADPATGFLSGLGITDGSGYLAVKPDMSTAVPGIFGAGDVCAKVLRQVVTATNDGAIAAQSAIKYLRG